MKKRLLIILCVLFCIIFLIGIVSGGAVKDFWIDKGLPIAEAEEIEKGNPSQETIAKAEALQNPEPIIETNQTEIEKQKKDRAGFFFMSIFGVLALCSVIFLMALYIRWGIL